MVRNKKWISIATSIMMLFTMTGASVFAAEPAQEPQDDQMVQEQEVTPEEQDAVQEAAEPAAEDAVQGGDVQAPEEETSEIPLQVAPIPDQKYTGSAIKPEVSVTSEGKALEEGTDYQVAYQNNTYVSDKWPKALVTGLGAYEGQTADASFKITAPTSLGAVSGLKAIAGYDKIKLTWNKVDGADTYYVLRSDKAKVKGWPRNLKNLSAYGTNGVLKSAVKNNPYWENNLDVDKYKTYSYTVQAAMTVKYANAADPAKYTTKEIKSASKSISKKCVSKLRVTVTSKQTVTLKSLGGGKKYKVKKGQKLVTEGYGGGKYYFKKKIKGKTYNFRIMNVRVRKAKASYDKKYDYTKAEAEYFINDYKYTRASTTNKSRLIWASLYTQHVYAFKKDGGKWVLEKDWDCSSGSASAPSPTGELKIHKRIKSRHHIQYWSCFSTLNALHGIKPVKYAGYNWVRYLGNPKSNGCIRNANENATWIWNNCGIGTKVLVY